MGRRGGGRESKCPSSQVSLSYPHRTLQTSYCLKCWCKSRSSACRYGSLREVPGYQRFIQERFERCLDLYLCPRQRKMRVGSFWQSKPHPLPCPQVQVDPDDLIPKLPKPRDLRPFPTTETMVRTGTPYPPFPYLLICLQVYEGHSGMVRCVGIEPLGQWMASGRSLPLTAL